METEPVSGGDACATPGLVNQRPGRNGECKLGFLLCRAFPHRLWTGVQEPGVPAGDTVVLKDRSLGSEISPERDRFPTCFSYLPGCILRSAAGLFLIV